MSTQSDWLHQNFVNFAFILQLHLWKDALLWDHGIMSPQEACHVTKWFVHVLKWNSCQLWSTFMAKLEFYLHIIMYNKKLWQDLNFLISKTPFVRVPRMMVQICHKFLISTITFKLVIGIGLWIKYVFRNRCIQFVQKMVI